MNPKIILFLLLAGILITSCQDGDDNKRTAQHTIVAYMMVDGLDSYIRDNIKDMVTASEQIPEYENILAFLDYSGRNSYIIKITQGKIDTVMDYKRNLVNSNPEVMADVLQWCFSNYPAENYGLIFGSHGSSWIFSNDTIATTSTSISAKGKKQHIGASYSNDGPINIPTFAKVLETLPHQQFILFDLCAAQSIETAYEIRKSVDYIVASPAEIPDSGAQFKILLPYMFKDLPAEIGRQYYQYYAQKDSSTKPPISVIKTSELDNLAYVTRLYLQNILTDYPTDITLDGLIYYFTIKTNGHTTPICYDMNDFMLHHLPSTDYTAWKEQYDKVVVYKGLSSKWTTVYPIVFSSFTADDDTFGGVSMFVPSTLYSDAVLSDYKKTAWYNAIYVN